MNKRKHRRHPHLESLPLPRVMRPVICTGQILTALWAVVPRLIFTNSCLATVFYGVGMVMVCQNGHIGSRLKAMVVIPGGWWVGSICAGITVSFLKLQPCSCSMLLHVRSVLVG